jgi:Ca2+-binding RTX toxin-like protein
LVFTTNDIPGCPKGGLLSRTDKRDLLNGKDGEDKVRGLGGPDNLYGVSGNDKLYGGPDGDYELIGEEGDDVLHGATKATLCPVTGGATMCSTEAAEPTICLPKARVRTFSTAEMATITSTRTVAGIRISSIAVKDGTNTIPTSSTKSTAVARCTFIPLAVAPLSTVLMMICYVVPSG